MTKPGRPPKPAKLKRNYTNQTYVRVAIYPKTKDHIKAMAKQEGMSMVDWLDVKVRKT